MVGCYIQDNVRVGDGAQLTSAMVCEGAVIMHDAVVHPGSIISFQVSLLKHPHNVDTRLYCPQTWLSLDFQCWDDASGLK